MFKPTKNQILMGVAVLVIVLTAVLLLVKSMGGGFAFPGMGMSKDAITKQTVDYLNKSVLQMPLQVPNLFQ